MRKQEKPGRPFGVTLAILASVILYSIIPLIMVGGVLLVEDHFRSIEETSIILPGYEVQEGFSGGDFRGGVTDGQLALQGGIAVGFMLIAFFAWRGRPAYMRQGFIAAVTLISAALIYLTVNAPANNESSLSGGSADSAFQSLSIIQIIMYVLVPLYVIWYLNRGPARAFYRGYYVSPPEA